ncbi:MAG: ubiquitin-like small modifier protein 1 [Acidimicrobiales bacterium]
MDVTLRVPAALRQLAEDRSACTAELPEGSTVDDLLDVMARDRPALERRVRDEQRVLRPHVNLFVGDKDIRSLDGPGTVLHHGDEVSIVAAISGG